MPHEFWTIQVTSKMAATYARTSDFQMFPTLFFHILFSNVVYLFMEGKCCPSGNLGSFCQHSRWLPAPHISQITSFTFKPLQSTFWPGWLGATQTLSTCFCFLYSPIYSPKMTYPFHVPPSMAHSSLILCSH